MVASIGALTSAAQGVSYYERDGYYAKDDAEHRAASAWLGTGAAEAGLEGTVDPEAFRAVLEGVVPDGSGHRLGRMGKDGERQHRPGRDLTLSAPKSVSLAGLVGGDARVVDAHDRAVARTVAWFEKNVAETRMKDPETGRMVRTGGQKTVVAAFRHDTSRNLDPALHTHAVIANMVKDADGKWRSMSNEKLYESKMLLGALYRNELAAGLSRLGYGIDKIHADGRFEIAGVSRDVVEAFSTRRAEIQAAMAERNLGSPADNPRLAERAALMTRSAKRDIDRDELGDVWQKQAAGLGFDAKALVAEAEREAAVSKTAGPAMQGPETTPGTGYGAGSVTGGRRETGGVGGSWRGPECELGTGRRGRCLGGGASLGARGGVRAHRFARRGAGLEPGRGPGRRHRARGRGTGGGRNLARRAAAGAGGPAHHRPRRRRRARDHRADVDRPGPRCGADARPRRRQGAPQRSPDARPEGGP